MSIIQIITTYGCHEAAIVQSMNTKLLPQDIMSNIDIGDVLVSIQCINIANITYTDQLQMIKYGPRPILLGFICTPKR